MATIHRKDKEMSQVLVRVLAERGCFQPGSYRGFKAKCPVCYKVVTHDMAEKWIAEQHEPQYIELKEFCEHTTQVYSDNFDNAWMEFKKTVGESGEE